MKFTVNRSQFLDALAFVATVIPSRSPKPVLSCVRIEATASTVTVCGTSLELVATATVASVDVAEQGVTLAPADKLRDVFGRLGDDNLGVSLEGSEMVVRGAMDTVKLFTQSPTDFPPMPVVEGDTFTMPGETFAAEIAALAPCVSPDGIRYAYNGILIHDDGTMVATDGKRLAKVAGKGKHKRFAIVPVAAMKIAAKLEGDIAITFSENAAKFNDGDRWIVSNLLEGQFPPYEEVIPKDPHTIVTTGGADAIAFVGRASLLTSEDSKGIRLEVGKAGMKASSRNPEQGESASELPAKVDGPGIVIGVNPKYAADAIKACGENVRIGFTAPNRPVVFHGGNVTAVVMPVNLQ